MKKKMIFTPEVNRIMRLIRSQGLHTVCQSARCPNLTECFNHQTATFLLMGDICTRQCRFCGVEKGCPQSLPDPHEPERIAVAVKELGLSYVVLTSVTRDDLEDEGVGHFLRTVDWLHTQMPEIQIEILTPDFQRNHHLLSQLAWAPFQVFNHNLETVPDLYAQIRPFARYETSLRLLGKMKELNPHLIVKSGLMVGLGETVIQLESVFRDLVDIHCDILTIGQYFPPSPQAFPLVEMKDENFFKDIENMARSLGINLVAAGTYVRSSYHAENFYSACTSIVSHSF